MLTGPGLILLLTAAGLLLWAFSRFDRAIDDEGTDAGPEVGDSDQIVSQVAAAQRLRRMAGATSDPEERARLIRLAEEADGTAEKIRQGLLSDQ